MKTFLVLLVAIGCVFGAASAQTPEKLLITAKLEQNGTYLITGMVRDGGQNPVQNAQIFITTWSGTAKTMSDATGMFSYELPAAPLSGKFDVNIKAQKDGYVDGHTNTSFFVNDKPMQNENPPLGATFKIVTADKMREDPLALKILKNIEQNKQQESERLKKLQEMDEKQKFIEQQREIANQDLLADLGALLVQFDPFNPRNAFVSFVSQMDATVQGIYWAQFNFTETKTKEGLAALQAVLDSGGTEQEARKAFYEKAATPRDELLKANDGFNTSHRLKKQYSD